MSAQPVITPTAVTKGFAVPCLHCHEVGNVHANIADLSELHCNECDTDYTLADVREALAAWSAFVAWVETAPVVPS